MMDMCNTCKFFESGECSKSVLCVNGSKYAPIKNKTYGIKKNPNKKSNRMGSQAEMINHQNTVDTISSNMTPNSGAGKVKGDEQIRGLVNIMQEVKTQEITRARGHSQFTIKREWLDKLDREAPAENMDFWYLNFSFKDNDEQMYTVIDSRQMQDIVATMVEDRKIAKQAQNKIDTANKRRIMIEAENTKLQSEIDYLKAKIKELEDDNGL